MLAISEALGASAVLRRLQPSDAALLLLPATSRSARCHEEHRHQSKGTVGSGCAPRQLVPQQQRRRYGRDVDLTARLQQLAFLARSNV